MKRINLLTFGIVLIFIIGLTSCSGDSDSDVTITVITSDYMVNINENPSNGQIIGTVPGSTNQGIVDFTILQQTPNGAFAIDSSTGQLTVVDASYFDYETNISITGIVKVANEEVSENSNITININDLIETHIFIGDVTLYSQEDVDGFGAENYTRITGDLNIGSIGYPNIFTDLSSLTSLKSIGGNFNIWENTTLLNLDGLNGLERVEGHQTVIEADLIQNVDGFESLHTAVNFLIDASSLENLNGLSNLTFVQGYFWIHNTKIENLNGLSNLTTVTDSFGLNNNGNLNSLEGLLSLSDINTFGVSNSNNLVDLIGLSVLTNINFLGLSNNNGLLNLNGLSNVNSIKRLILYENENLENLNGINTLSTGFTEINITLNPALDDFCGIEDVLINYGSAEFYTVNGNLYNPTQQDIIDGNCSL